MTSADKEGRRLNWVGGQEREPASGAYVAKVNPSTGAHAYEVADSEFLDVVHSVAAANQVIGEWQKTPARQRAAILRKIADLIDLRSERLVALEVFDLGLPINWVKTQTVPQAAQLFRAYGHMIEQEAEQHESFFRSLDLEAADKAQALTSHQAPMPKTTSASEPPTKASSGLRFQQALPEGMVGLLLPANEALYELSRKLAPALAAGCCVIAKPSHFASSTSLELARLTLEAGLPAGVFNILCGTGEKAGAALIQHPGISVLSLTGSTTTGQQVLQLTSDQFKRWQMSLSGRNPVLVFADANLQTDIAEIVSICFDFHRAVRGSRLFVQETIYQEFLDAFRAEMKSLAIGEPGRASTRLGPLANREDKLRFEAVCKQALEERGKPLLPLDRDLNLPADSRDGFYVAPQAFYDFTLCSSLQQEEIVGPFVTIASFKYQHDAIKHANTSAFGQAAYLFTSSLSKASKVASRLEAGEIYVNSRALRDHSVSSGGLKTSGLGPDSGHELLNFFRRRTQIRFN